MFLLSIVTGADQVQDPAGTDTIEPSVAESMAACTAVCEHDEAVTVAADVTREKLASIKKTVVIRASIGTSAPLSSRRGAKPAAAKILIFSCCSEE